MKNLLGIAVLAAIVALLVVPLPWGAGGDEAPTHTVVRGDTFSKLALRYSASVDDLRAWNPRDGDVIHVGEQLRVGPGTGTGGKTQLISAIVAEDGPVRGRFADWQAARAAAKAQADAEARAAADAAQASAEAAGGPVADGAAAARGSTRRTKLRRANRDASGRFHPPDSPDGSGADAAYDVVTAMDGQRPPPDFDNLPTLMIEEAPGRIWPVLQMPRPRPCLDQDPSAALGDSGPSFGRSQGLDPDAVSAAVERFQEQTLRCYDRHPGADGEVMLRLKVGCDGRMRQVSVKDDSTGTPGFADCVAEVFQYAPFPTHARDEVEVLIPMQFRAP